MASHQSFKKALNFLLIIIGIVLIGVVLFIALYYFQIRGNNGNVFSSGVRRTYILYVPESYKPDEPVPLVISLHGFADWPTHHMMVTGWNQIAEENGFLVVYPSGTGFPLRWLAGGTGDPQPDVKFISDLIDQLEGDYNIDENRIFVNGLSNGGGMSFVLACKLSERVAAFAGVAGAYVFPWDECQSARPVPAIIFHGTADRIVPFKGGEPEGPGFTLPDITGWVDTLAEKSGCSAEPEEIPTQGEVSGRRYSGCDQGAEVVFYVIEDGGHSWPGGGYLPKWIVGHTTQDINATRVMWEFFQRHTKK